jgi:DNA-binding PadR family transcriptional regulator
MKKPKLTAGLVYKIYLFLLWLIKKKPSYGYEIIKILQEESIRSGHPPLGANRIYPILKKMEKIGWIEKSKEKERKKLYKITPKGIELLESEKKKFRGLIGEFLKDMIS